MNIVFLDFDGVLNSREFLIRQAENTPLRDANLIDAEKCALVERFCAEHEASIVVSSAWRLRAKRPVLAEILGSKGLTAKVLGVTPSIPGATRGDEIRQWLEVAARVGRFQPVTGIVIFDDDQEMAAMDPWLVRTSFETGVREPDLELASKIIRGPTPLFVGDLARREA